MPTLGWTSSPPSRPEPIMYTRSGVPGSVQEYSWKYVGTLAGLWLRWRVYISDIEGYALDLGGFALEIVSRPDLIESGRLYCGFLDAGESIDDILLALFIAYDTTAADQPYTREQLVLLTIYGITAAADNFCPEHRNTVDDFLAGDGSD